MTALPMPGRSHPLRLVVLGGVVAGALDIAYACTYWAIKADVPIQRIFQSVAAGVLGRDASRAGAWPTAILGLGLHFFIATSMAVTYYLVARRWPLLWRRPVVMGLLYGLLLYAIMNHIVVPLSAAGGGGGGPTDQLWIGLSIAVHAVFIGLPIALFTRAALRASSEAGE